MSDGEQPTVSEHDLQCKHRLPGDAVLCAQQSARIRGDIATDRGDCPAGRIGGEPQAVAREGCVEVAVEDARLDDGELIGDGHLEDVVHRQSREHDLASARDRTTSEAGSRPSRHNSDAVLRRDAQGGLHIVDRSCRHESERRA